MTSPPRPRKIPYRHHHVSHHKHTPFPSQEPALIDQGVVDKLLVDSVKTICEEVAANEGIQSPIIESVALESLSAAADECREKTQPILAPRDLLILLQSYFVF